MLVVCLGDTDRNLIETDTKNVTDLEIDHLKNPQFLPNQAYIQSILPNHKLFSWSFSLIFIMIG